MTFGAALTGMRSANTDLEVSGNNIANASTVGFKQSRAQFSDVYASTAVGGGANAVGSGVRVSDIAQQFSQGNISFTENSLDLAINGAGFFMLSDAGAQVFSRAGQFGLNQEGYIVNSSGARLQGRIANESGAVGGTEEDLQIQRANILPRQTSLVNIEFNLGANEPVLERNGNTVLALGTEIGQVQLGLGNNYTGTTVEVNGAATTLPAGSAGLIASQLSNIAGVQASATTTVAFAFSGGVSPGGIGNGELTINNLEISGNDITEVAENINLQPGLSAVVTGTSITVTSADGSDVLFDVNGGGNGLELIVGADEAAVTAAQALNTAGNGTLTNFGALNAQEIIQGSAEEQAVIGGDIVVTLDETVTTFTAQSGNIFQTTPLLTPFTANAFDPTDPDTYNHTTSSDVFDTLGTRHQLQMYFVKQSAASAGTNVWSMYVTVDGQDVGDPVGGALTASQAEYTLRFNEDGSLDTINSDDILISNWRPLDSEGNANGAEGPLLSVNGGAIPVPVPAESSNFQINVTGSTQYDDDFGVFSLDQTGYASGEFSGLNIDQTGIMFARYSNGQSLILGQVSLAYFQNEQGLTPVGDSSWVESFESGQPIPGLPLSASLGAIQSGAVEDSNVELAEELVNLIIAQRNFQANARTIETANEVTQTVINLR